MKRLLYVLNGADLMLAMAIFQYTGNAEENFVLLAKSYFDKIRWSWLLY